MKRIKVSVALITMFGLPLGTAGVASAKTVSRVSHAKVSQTHNQEHTSSSKEPSS